MAVLGMGLGVASQNLADAYEFRCTYSQAFMFWYAHDSQRLRLAVEMVKFEGIKMQNS